MEEIQIIILCGFAFVAIGAFVYLFFEFFKNSNSSKKETKTSDEIIEETFPLLNPIIYYFRGQCNSFKNVVETFSDIQRCEDVFRYTEKVIHFHADETLKKWWEMNFNLRVQWDLVFYKIKAKQFIITLNHAGVVSSTEQIIEWDETSSTYYIPFDNIKKGDICNVIQPYWEYENEIFERGLVIKSNNII